MYLPGDLFTFRFEDMYHATVLISNHSEGKMKYMYFGLLTQQYENNPSLEPIFDSNIIATIIQTDYTSDRIIQAQPNVEKAWLLFPTYAPFIVGLLGIAIEYNIFMKRLTDFNHLGNVLFQPGLNHIGAKVGAKNVGVFLSTLANPENQIKLFGFKKIPFKYIFLDQPTL